MLNSESKPTTATHALSASKLLLNILLKMPTILI